MTLLALPTSVTTAPGLRWGCIWPVNVFICDNGVHKTIRSAPRTASFKSFVMTSARASFRPSAMLESRRTKAWTLSANCFCLMAKASEPPINPIPITQILFQRILIGEKVAVQVPPVEKNRTDQLKDCLPAWIEGPTGAFLAGRASRRARAPKNEVFETCSKQ